MSLDKKIIRRNFDKHAENYNDNCRIQNRVAHELVSRAGDLSGDVLDIGAGTGAISQMSGQKLTQIDLSPKMCEISGAICADAEALPFKDNCFDKVISSLTIQWVNDLKTLGTEIKRILRKDGEFFISSFAPGTFKELAECYQELDGKKHLIDFTSSMQIFAALKMAGLEGVQIHSQNIIYQYANLREVLGEMKNIGASYPVAKGQGLRGKGYFAELEKIYKTKFENGGTLPVTWQALYVSGRA